MIYRCLLSIQADRLHNVVQQAIASITAVLRGKNISNVLMRLLTIQCDLGETSKLICCSINIQQPAAANLYRKCYTLLLNAAAFWLQPAVTNFDVFLYSYIYVVQLDLLITILFIIISH